MYHLDRSTLSSYFNSLVSASACHRRKPRYLSPSSTPSGERRRRSMEGVEDGLKYRGLQATMTACGPYFPLDLHEAKYSSRIVILWTLYTTIVTDDFILFNIVALAIHVYTLFDSDNTINVSVLCIWTHSKSSVFNIEKFSLCVSIIIRSITLPSSARCHR